MVSSLNRWLPAFTPKANARFRLFCLPYAGGGASVYYNWTNELGPEIELYPIQLPGHEDRFAEQPFVQLSSLIETLRVMLQPFLTVPFAFFGHSMGALIAFELTRYLRKHDHLSPTHLFVSASQAPQATSPEAPINQLSNALFLDKVSQRYNAIPQAILNEPELLNLLLPTLRADFRLIETYSYQHEDALDCPITAIGGNADVRVPADTLIHWKEQTRKDFSSHVFNGGHFFLREERKAITEIISRSLLENS